MMDLETLKEFRRELLGEMTDPVTNEVYEDELTIGLWRAVQMIELKLHAAEKERDAETEELERSFKFTDQDIVY